MIKVKNIQTGEIFEVWYVDFKDERVIGRTKRPRADFFDRFGSYVHVDGATEDGMPVYAINDGYELIKGIKRSKRQPKAQPTTEIVDVRPTVDTTTEAPVEMEATIEAEAVEEVATEDTTTTETPKATAKERAKKLRETATTQPTAVPTLDAAAQAFAALTPLFSGVEANVTAAVMERIQPLMERVEAICGRAPQTVIHVIKRGDVETKIEGEVFHANFDDVCQRVARGTWVYLYGPTGSGKNVMAEQVARALGLEFHYQAHTLDRFELTGFIDSVGCYQPTEFYKAYTEGGLFMLDELDASDENALVTLNSACNGYFAFPCGTVKQHPDFRCIAAGNTCGRGGTDDYTARHTMDVSSLGRFVPRYHGYCDAIDTAAANGNAELVEFVHALRGIRRQVGCQIIASPRQIKEIVKDEAQGIKLSQTLTDVFGTYLTEDELNIVQERLREDTSMDDNRYAKAFRRVKAVEY